jgi:hypothetical protein
MPIDVALSVGHIQVDITTADGAHNSDIGIYNAAATTLAHVGATAMGSTGINTFALAGGTQSISAGLDYLCLTSTASTIQLAAYQNSGSVFNWASVASTTSGGALNSSFTPPTLSNATASYGAGELEIAFTLEP